MECSKCHKRLLCGKCSMFPVLKAPVCERCNQRYEICKKGYEKEIDAVRSELARLRQAVSKQKDRLVFLRLIHADPANEVFKGDVALVIHGTELIYAHRFVLVMIVNQSALGNMFWIFLHQLEGRPSLSCKLAYPPTMTYMNGYLGALQALLISKAKAGKSPVFCRMLECDMLEKKTGMIPIDDASLPVMQAVIKYCYTADISFTNEVPADEVLQVAHKYEINHLRNECEDELCQRINAKNVLEMLRLGKKFTARALQDVAAKYFKDHFDAVVPAVLENL